MTRTILIVEGNELFRSMLRSLLILHGYQVLVAGNARDGLAIAENNEIDAVLTDADMPEIDGIEFCAQLHAQTNPAVARIPVWVMTGSLRPALKQRAEQAGALMVLRKPFNVVEACRQFESEFESRTGKRRLPQIA